ARFRNRRHDVDVLAAKLAVSERDQTVSECKKRVILAQADVGPRVPLGAALAHDDIAGANGFAAELLHAEALALAVAAVAGRAACFLMCHLGLLRFRRLLGRGISRCSIFCRCTFGFGLGWSGLFRLGAGGLLVLRSRVRGRLASDVAR